MKTELNQYVIQAQKLGKTVQAPGADHQQGLLTILEEVDLTAQAGEAIAILGSSGAGKSTLLGLMAGLDTPTSGTVVLFGQDLAALDEDGRAALRAGQVGFIFQSFQLLPGLTALENVMMPLELSGKSSTAREIALDSLRRVGLKARVTHYPHQLSGGEQQRVAIARAFAVRPRILFADEPTGNLDQSTGQKIIELMFSLRDEHKSTLIMVTHDQALSAFCNREYHLEAGRMLDQ